MSLCLCLGASNAIDAALTYIRVPRVSQAEALPAPIKSVLVKPLPGAVGAEALKNADNARVGYHVYVVGPLLCVAACVLLNHLYCIVHIARCIHPTTYIVLCTLYDAFIHSTTCIAV